MPSKRKTIIITDAEQLDATRSANPDTRIIVDAGGQRTLHRPGLPVRQIAFVSPSRTKLSAREAWRRVRALE